MILEGIMNTSLTGAAADCIRYKQITSWGELKSILRTQFFKNQIYTLLAKTIK
jgi:hypothetical protein